MLKEQINKNKNEKFIPRLWKVDTPADVMEEKLACPRALRPSK